jgi:DTW domain-containing protein YfiP
LRQRKTKDPCQVCFLHRERCICAAIPRLSLRTRVSLLIHAKELKRTTNTGRHAIEALENSQMIVRGILGAPADLSKILDPEYQTYLLYPSEDAIELSAADLSRPIHLLVPDGNWRQAAKVHSRHPELSTVPRVKISAMNNALQHLRREHFEEGMSTLEAIARSLGVIEGEAVGESLLSLYQAKLTATISGRPKKRCHVPFYVARRRKKGRGPFLYAK